MIVAKQTLLKKINGNFLRWTKCQLIPKEMIGDDQIKHKCQKEELLNLIGGGPCGLLVPMWNGVFKHG